MDKDTQRRRDQLADAIIAYWQALDRKLGRRTSQNELAKELGNISPTTLSNLLNKVRLPNEENMHRLAARIGPKIYDILGVPARMPDDPFLHEVVELLYDDQITEADRQEILGFIRKRLESKNIEPALAAATD